MTKLRKERSYRLDKPLHKKIEGKLKKEIHSQEDKRNLLQSFMEATEFYMEEDSQVELIHRAKNFNELLYSFSILMQRALNQGRTFAVLEDVKYIPPLLFTFDKSQIGIIYTLGIIEGEIKKIKIQCCAVPVGKRKGRIISGEMIDISPFPLGDFIKDYDIFIKFYPQKPENHGQWEAGLIVSIYSAIINKDLPPSTLILGGIDKKGKLQAVSNMNNLVKILAKENRSSIFYPRDNEKDMKNLSKDISSHSFKAIKHIEEIITRLEIYNQ